MFLPFGTCATSMSISSYHHSISFQMEKWILVTVCYFRTGKNIKHVCLWIGELPCKERVHHFLILTMRQHSLSQWFPDLAPSLVQGLGSQVACAWPRAHGISLPLHCASFFLHILLPWCILYPWVLLRAKAPTGKVTLKNSKGKITGPWWNKAHGGGEGRTQEGHLSGRTLTPDLKWVWLWEEQNLCTHSALPPSPFSLERSWPRPDHSSGGPAPESCSQEPAGTWVLRPHFSV